MEQIASIKWKFLDRTPIKHTFYKHSLAIEHEVALQQVRTFNKWGCSVRCLGGSVRVTVTIWGLGVFGRPLLRYFCPKKNVRDPKN